MGVSTSCVGVAKSFPLPLAPSNGLFLSKIGFKLKSKNITKIKRIVSGGQSGVDRAALDCAIQHNISHGGWCPKGRISEDGIIDLRYQLKEIMHGSYRQRTRQNVLDSDGTLILNLGVLDGGTLATLKFVEQFKKPSLVVQLENETSYINLANVLDWIKQHHIEILNVAGPRESKRVGIYFIAMSFLDRLFS